MILSATLLKASTQMSLMGCFFFLNPMSISKIKQNILVKTETCLSEDLDPTS